MKNRIAVVVAVLVCIGMLPIGAAAQQSVTPVNGGQVTSPLVLINNGPGNQTDPHVSGNLATYTDGGTTIRYFDFLTGANLAVPAGAPGQNTLSDTNGTLIAFSRTFADLSTHVFVYDTTTNTVTEIAPQPGAMRFSPKIGGHALAYEPEDNTQRLHSRDPGVAKTGDRQSCWLIVPQLSVGTENGSVN